MSKYLLSENTQNYGLMGQVFMDAIPEITVLFQRFGIALVLGLIIGIEREKEKSEAFAGIRTFPLISLMGCTTAMISQLFISWTFAAAFAALAALVITAHIHATRVRTGITTEIAALLVFVFGGLVWWEMTPLAAALSFVTVLLLATKEPLERVSQKIGRQDIAAALQFGLITLIILPVLPNRTFGPLDVLNPHTVWLMVVLIAGINFIGYILIKILGARQGVLLAGVLGGIGSSTAVTLSFTARSKKAENLAPLLAMGTVIASSIMFVRVLIEAFTVNPAVGKILLIPLAFAAMAGLLCCMLVWLFRLRNLETSSEKEDIKTANPFELWPAILFGLLFAVILFVSKGAQVLFGTSGIYLSSIITGLTDVDPITLSLSNLAGETLTETVAARGITLAALANTFVKMLITFTGAPKLIRFSLPIFSVMIITGLVVCFVLI